MIVVETGAEIVYPEDQINEGSNANECVYKEYVGMWCVIGFTYYCHLTTDLCDTSIFI
jgi:hypothetical protein